MTLKSELRAVVEKLTRFEPEVDNHSPYCKESETGDYLYREELLEAIDALPDEPVSEKRQP